MVGVTSIPQAGAGRGRLLHDGGIMRILALLLLASPAIAQMPPFQPVATISEIMVAITLPYSDALLYIERNAPKNDRDWELLQMQALMLAESGNLLMIKGRAKNQALRSEEHTSELQSLAYLVCRLLLEKKKTNKEK